MKCNLSKLTRITESSVLKHAIGPERLQQDFRTEQNKQIISVTVAHSETSAAKNVSGALVLFV